MDEFDALISLVRKSERVDPWVENKGIDGYCKESINEANEAISALNNKDYSNLKEELGDILLDWANACILAEKQGDFTINEIIESARAKLAWRKPYLSDEKPKKMTKEETERIWYMQKEKEKNAQGKK